MQYRRYAIYFAPETGSDLAAFGASWLGWDAATGRAVPQPDVTGLDVARITETPRKYGFHGTLKPPFAPTAKAAEIADAASAYAATVAPFEIPAIRLSHLGPFLALTPASPSAPLAALAAGAVRLLDRFRAPPSEAELAKRRTGGLTDWQEALLQRWGYPFVMEEFRFHLTLTGRLSRGEATAAEAALTPLTAPFTASPLPVKDIALFGEAEDGRFRIVDRFALTG